MKQPQTECIAYYAGTPTRQELLPVVQALFDLQSTVLELGLVVSDDGRNEEVVETLRGTVVSSERIAALIREMMNAGVDPEWDHRP